MRRAAWRACTAATAPVSLRWSTAPSTTQVRRQWEVRSSGSVRALVRCMTCMGVSAVPGRGVAAGSSGRCAARASAVGCRKIADTGTGRPSSADRRAHTRPAPSESMPSSAHGTSAGTAATSSTSAKTAATRRVSGSAASCPAAILRRGNRSRSARSSSFPAAVTGNRSITTSAEGCWYEGSASRTHAPSPGAAEKGGVGRV